MLYAVRLDGTFSYILAGAEGSVNNATLMRFALLKSLYIPERCFYLSDAGFGSQAGLLVPYGGGVRYHLQEWAAGRDRPQTAEELCNLHHLQLQITVELAFSRVKRKFWILRSAPPEYAIKKQIHIIYTYTGLSNFLRAFRYNDNNNELPAEDVVFLEDVRNWINKHIDASNLKKLQDEISSLQWDEHEDYHNNIREAQWRLGELISVVEEGN